MYLCLRGFLTFCCVLRLCAGQLTSTAPCSTCRAMPTCTGCTINVGVITATSTSWIYGDPAVGTPFSAANLLFTAYSVTTRSTVAGNCTRHTSSPVPIIDTYTVPFATYLSFTVPTSLWTVQYTDARYISYSNAAYSEFLSDAYSSFKEEFGYRGCTATVPPSQTFPTFIGGRLAKPSQTALSSAIPANSSATVPSSANSTKGPQPVRRVHSTQIIVSVVVPTAGLIILLLCFILIRRYRKKRNQAAFTNQSAMTSNVQLYVDRKAELEDQERQRHELEAEGIRYEMDGEGTIFEISGDENTRIGLASFNRSHELRGTERSQELEVPGNI